MGIEVNKLEYLKEKALQVRRSIVEMIYYGGSGHPGGSLSCVEILVALYFNLMNIDPDNPGMVARDRFILSKAHAAPAHYAVLAEKGFINKNILNTFSTDGSKLQKHIDMHLIPGVEISGGSLGQGLSVGCGMAMSAKMDKSVSKIYVCLGDGELDEGQNWEAAMCAAHYKLDNITAFVDRNRLQVDGTTDDIMNIEPLADKWLSFGWNVEVVDGHDFNALVSAVEKLQSFSRKPGVIIADTIKGKGVSFLENQVKWHAGAFTEEQYRKAFEELK